MTGPAVILVLLAVLDSGSAEMLASAAPVIAVTFLTSRLSARAIAQAARRRGWDGALDDRMEARDRAGTIRPAGSANGEWHCLRAVFSLLRVSPRAPETYRIARASTVPSTGHMASCTPGGLASGMPGPPRGARCRRAGHQLCATWTAQCLREREAAARADADADRADGLPSQAVGASQVQEQLPHIAGAAAGATFRPEEAHCYPQLFVNAIAEQAKLEGPASTRESRSSRSVAGERA